MFALIINNTIKLGPIPWDYTVFRNFLVRKNFNIDDLPVIFPGTAIITENWQIKRALLDTVPGYNKIFEELAGPNWTIGAVDVYGKYNVVNCSLSVAKVNIKNFIAASRYNTEIEGINVKLENETTFFVDTKRDKRLIFSELLNSTEPVYYKNSDGTFTILTVADISNISKSINTHIQKLYTKENLLLTSVEAASSLEELKAINITFKE